MKYKFITEGFLTYENILEFLPLSGYGMIIRCCVFSVPPQFRDDDGNIIAAHGDKEHKEVMQNDTFKLYCPAKGNPRPVIIWYKDDVVSDIAH